MLVIYFFCHHQLHLVFSFFFDTTNISWISRFLEKVMNVDLRLLIIKEEIIVFIRDRFSLANKVILYFREIFHTPNSSQKYNSRKFFSPIFAKMFFVKLSACESFSP